MNEEKKNKFVKAVVTTGVIVSCFWVALVLINANYAENIPLTPVEKEKVSQAVHVWTPTGAEGSPTGSGFLGIYFMNLSTYTNGGYGDNTSSTHEGWCDANMPDASPNAWANADEFDIESFASETTFVIMARTRYNQTHAWNGTMFFNTSCDAQITVTCTSWTVGSNIANVSGRMNVTSNNSVFTYIYINWVWDNAGTGYQISDDAVLTVSEVYVEARF